MPPNSSKRTYDNFSMPNGNEAPSYPSPSKKSRVTSDSDSTPLWEMITGLQPLELSTILYNICSEDPSRADLVRSAYAARLVEERRRPPVNFDYISKDCWHTLNMKYKRLSASKQCDMMGDIGAVLRKSIKSVSEKAGPETRWETRRNALEVLRKISKSIMLCDERQIRHELMKDGCTLASFADAMLELAQGMSSEERERYKDEGLYEKLVELQTECEEWSINMPGLEDIYGVFDEDSEGDDEEEDEECQVTSGSYRPAQPLPKPASPPKRSHVFSVIELD
ncbi:hypothetical protein HYALB_00009703 [Hymenoscyphus albidus]|uniref:Uncharacterized protein n=1 Tax=Hymenoscyphus albidus TaxID=595503 RepID=A0A9N9LBF9_9HELO|nr:hypothetical protein HYALB_00009703 [Hymenoscyphus albidus]